MANAACTGYLPLLNKWTPKLGVFQQQTFIILSFLLIKTVDSFTESLWIQVSLRLQASCGPGLRSDQNAREGTKGRGSLHPWSRTQWLADSVLLHQPNSQHGSWLAQKEWSEIGERGGGREREEKEEEREREREYTQVGSHIFLWSNLWSDIPSLFCIC